MLYNNLSGYFRQKYGQRIKKICVDGGFSCPNRDGKCGTGGCIYCGERGAGEHIERLESIREQVERGLQNASDNDKLLVYFQNFSNNQLLCCCLTYLLFSDLTVILSLTCLGLILLCLVS